jgi:hypothetical protein
MGRSQLVSVALWLLKEAAVVFAERPAARSFGNQLGDVLDPERGDPPMADARQHRRPLS